MRDPLHFKEFAEGPGASKNEAEPKPKVALMLRGRNNRVELRAVDVQDECLEKAWRAQREERLREQQHLKKITLDITERQQIEELEQQQREVVQTVENLALRYGKKV